jgi:hypothetical protein
MDNNLQRSASAFFSFTHTFFCHLFSHLPITSCLRLYKEYPKRKTKHDYQRWCQNLKGQFISSIWKILCLLFVTKTWGDRVTMVKRFVSNSRYKSTVSWNQSINQAPRMKLTHNKNNEYVDWMEENLYLFDVWTEFSNQVNQFWGCFVHSSKHKHIKILIEWKYCDKLFCFLNQIDLKRKKNERN